MIRSLAWTLTLAAVLLWAPESLQAQYFRFGKNKVQYQSKDWFYVQSKHFDVYYYEPGGKYLAEFAARAAEDSYVDISKDFQHEISDRIAILVYQSHNDFAVNNAAPLPEYAEGIGGVTELFKNRIAIPFTGDYRSFQRVIHHELVHAVINDMFYGGSIQSIIQNNISLRIPAWFNEGLAEYEALGWDTQSDMYIRDAILNDNLAPIPYLSGYFAYRGGQSVWDYVSEQYGREKIGEIMQRLRLTRSVEASFQRATGLTLEELSERWQKALKKVHWPEMAAREDLDEIAKPIVTREKGYYNTSAAISPQGDRIAYISTKDGLFDVYITNANDGRKIEKLIDGQDNTEFESLKILTPGISWSPNGRQIAIAVKSGSSDAITVVDVRTKKSTQYRIPGIDAIISVAWSPDGGRIAFSGSMDAQTDIFVLDMASQETVNITNDIFSDHEPSWNPDGTAIVFHSDRGDYTQLGRFRPDNFEMIDHDYSQFDIYRVVLGSAEAERLTFDETWDDRSAKFGDDPNKLLFISDRNGIYNLYEKDLITGRERPLTDVLVGIMQVSLSRDANKAAIVSLKEGTPSIFMLKTPFDRQVKGDKLVPNVWAERVMQDSEGPKAPAITLASEATLQRNPLLRDASDGVPFVKTLERHPSGALASRSTTGMGTDGEKTDEKAAPKDTSQALTSLDKIDFRNYVFSDAFDAPKEDSEVDDEYINPFEPEDNVTKDGHLKQKKYKLTFSPDIIYGTAGYDALYGGVQGLTQMMFSDVLGNHQIYAATNLLIDLRNSDYLIAYSYLPKRIDYTLSVFHSARILTANGGFSYFRYRYYGGGGSMSLPLDKFRRLDFSLSLMDVSQTDINNVTVPSESKAFLYPSLSYTKDVTIPGYIAPASGYRYAVSLSGTPGGISNIRFGTLLGDFRFYQSLGYGYTIAVRGSAAKSFGPNAQRFYSTGVTNWINNSFDNYNGFPITEVSDFVFATPVMPIRGAEINTQNGTYFGLANAEFRFPLFAALLPGPIPLFPLYNLQGVGFIDTGTIRGGVKDEATEDLLDQFRFFGHKDLMVGMGFGLRTIMLGYPVRLDWAWPYNGDFGKRRVYFSIGFDF
ncbi:MAG: peptidase S9 [Rhodothermales bacterium]